MTNITDTRGVLNGSLLGNRKNNYKSKGTGASRPNHRRRCNCNESHTSNETKLSHGSGRRKYLRVAITLAEIDIENIMAPSVF
jgi:hypothetical protein